MLKVSRVNFNQIKVDGVKFLATHSFIAFELELTGIGNFDK